MNAPSKPDLKERINDLHNSLHECKIGILQELAGNMSKNIHELCEILYPRLCDGLYKAIKTFYGFNEEFPFYVWPGYDSVRWPAASSRRVQLCDLVEENSVCGISPAYSVSTLAKRWQKRETRKDDAVSPDPQAVAELQAAFENASVTNPVHRYFQSESGSSGSGLHYRIRTNPCSLFFSRLLHKPSSQDPTYIPGSTHRWLQKSSEKNIRADGEWHPLRGLAVEYRDKPGKEPGHHSYCLVTLEKKEDLFDAGRIIAKKLTETYGLTPWPPPLQGEGDVPEKWPFRAALYSPWLVSLFAPDLYLKNGKQGSESVKWNTFFNGDLPPGDFQERFEDGKAQVNSLDKAFRHSLRTWAKYSHWISLAFDSVPESLKGKPTPLGSLMLFSGEPLCPLFLTTTRTWVQGIYLLFRQHDSIGKATQDGASASRKMQEFRLTHEVRKLTGALVRSDQPIIRQVIGRQLISLSYPANGEPDRLSEDEDLAAEWPEPYAIRKGPLVEWLKSIVRTSARMSKLGEDALELAGIGNQLEEVLDGFIADELPHFEYSNEIQRYRLSPVFPNEVRKFIVRGWLAVMGNYFKHRLIRPEEVRPPCKFIFEGDCSGDFWKLKFTNYCVSASNRKPMGTRAVFGDDIRSAFQWRQGEGAPFGAKGVYGDARPEEIEEAIEFGPDLGHSGEPVTYFVTQLPMPRCFFSK